MDETVFFVLGGTLVVAAVVLAVSGLRAQEFPSRGQMAIVLVPFAALVFGTMTFAVLNAKSEPLGDENKEAAKAEQTQGVEHGVQEADNPGSEGAPTGGAQQPEASQPPSETLKVSSPPDGALNFDPATLDAKAGTVAIAYDNPSAVPHDIALEGPDGKLLDETQPGADATFTVSADLKPGKYVYYCTVPGHREAGMEGTLTVK